MQRPVHKGSSQREVQLSACTASSVAWGLKVSAGYTMAAPLHKGQGKKVAPRTVGGR